MLNIILFGAPGSGKGTQSKLIAQKYHLKHISTGELLRTEMKKQSELGKIAENYILKGNLLPDEIIMDILIKNIDDDLKNYNGILFDGFPRTLPQAEMLEKILHELNTEITLLIDLKVNEEELIKRLLKRAEIEIRNDDKPDIIKKRLEIYAQNAEPINEFYKKLNKYIAIDGMGTVEEVFSRIEKVINSKLNEAKN
ncbi:MAG TPA: adenylate kinase [Paludibacteraceae bacterium]|nr:adenylate kinase [Paludibacteraceae bacterium]HOK36865.1 adenylate kinase [Paludibacteraceae bacterium]HOL00816.1 adenylate kinase [Paludibacteraceae bacterium]HPC25971.1 adenylate kinase [Paludibacteraceae bacterium]HPO67947.1 adenylate kinase [Paludibacteraceae bacterium]